HSIEHFLTCSNISTLPSFADALDGDDEDGDDGHAHHRENDHHSNIELARFITIRFDLMLPDKLDTLYQELVDLLAGPAALSRFFFKILPKLIQLKPTAIATLFRQLVKRNQFSALISDYQLAIFRLNRQHRWDAFADQDHE